MFNIKTGLAIATIAVISAPSMAQAQNYTQRGTRNGAIAGAIIGGIIGDQRDNAFTGAVIGGLVGGAAGRAVGRSKDARFYGGNSYYRQGQSNFHPRQSFYGGQGFNSGFGIQAAPIHRGFSGQYGNSFYRGQPYRGNGFNPGFYGGGGYGGQRGCSNGRW